MDIPVNLDNPALMEADDTPITARKICDVLGRRQIAERVQRGISAVSNAAVEGRFPAVWFVVVREMCAEARIECPERLFGFLPPEPVQTPATTPTPAEDAA